MSRFRTAAFRVCERIRRLFVTVEGASPRFTSSVTKTRTCISVMLARRFSPNHGSRGFRRQAACCASVVASRSTRDDSNSSTHCRNVFCPSLGSIHSPRTRSASTVARNLSASFFRANVLECSRPSAPTYRARHRSLPRRWMWLTHPPCRYRPVDAAFRSSSHAFTSAGSKRRCRPTLIGSGPSPRCRQR